MRIIAKFFLDRALEILACRGGGRGGLDRGGRGGKTKERLQSAGGNYELFGINMYCIDGCFVVKWWRCAIFGKMCRNYNKEENI